MGMRKMMKKFFLPSVLFFILASNSHAQLFGNDEKMDKLLTRIKLMNASLQESVIPKINSLNSEVKNINGEIQNIKVNQAKLLQQMDYVKSSFPGLQGAIEQNSSQMIEQVQQMDLRLEDLDSQVKKGLTKQLNDLAITLNDQGVNQKSQLDQFVVEQKESMNQLIGDQKNEMGNLKTAMGKLQEGVGSHLIQVKDAVAKEIEQIVLRNEKSLSSFSNKNDHNFVAVQNALNKQGDQVNQKIDEAITVIQEVVTAVEGNKQSIDESFQAIQVQNESVKEGLGQVDRNTQLIDLKSQKVVEVIESSLQKQTDSDLKLNTLIGNLNKANENVNSSREAMLSLKKIMDQKLSQLSAVGGTNQGKFEKFAQRIDLVKDNLLIADTKLNKLADGLKALQGQSISSTKAIVSMQEKVAQVQTANLQTDQKFNKLIDSTKSMLAHSSKLGKDVQLSMQKIDAGSNQSNLTQQKINELIDILKAIAVKQNEIEEKFNSQQSNIFQALSSSNQAIEKSKVELVNSINGSKVQIQKDIGDSAEQLHAELSNSKVDIGKVITASRNELYQAVATARNDLMQSIATSHGESKAYLNDIRTMSNANNVKNDNILNSIRSTRRTKKSTAKK